MKVIHMLLNEALDFLDRSGLNTYPKIQKNDGDTE